MTRKTEAELIQLPTIPDHRGFLTVAGESSEIPFTIKRAYWVYGVPADESRGGHAHRNQTQFIVAANGSFEITVDNGNSTQTYLLDNPSRGLLMPPMLWHTLQNFSPGAVCLVLASGCYDEEDYIRCYSDYIKDPYHKN